MPYKIPDKRSNSTQRRKNTWVAQTSPLEMFLKAKLNQDRNKKRGTIAYLAFYQKNQLEVIPEKGSST